MDLLHSVSQWNTVEYITKRPAFRISIQPNQVDLLLQGVYDMLAEPNQTREKLSLIDYNHICVGQNIVGNVVKISNG